MLRTGSSNGIVIHWSVFCVLILIVLLVICCLLILDISLKRKPV